MHTDGPYREKWVQTVVWSVLGMILASHLVGALVGIRPIPLAVVTMVCFVLGVDFVFLLTRRETRAVKAIAAMLALTFLPLVLALGLSLLLGMGRLASLPDLWHRLGVLTVIPGLAGFTWGIAVGRHV